MKKTFSAAAAAVLLAAGPAQAVTPLSQQRVVWDQSPATGTLNNAWSNTTDSDVWADAVRFSTPTQIVGYTYYSDFDLSGYTAPDAFNLRIYTDNGTNPKTGATIEPTLILSENVGFTSVSAYTTFSMLVMSDPNVDPPVWSEEDFGMQVLHFDIPAFTMQAGKTYWIGLSGNGFEAAQWTIDNDGHDDATAEWVWNPATNAMQFNQLQTGAGGAADEVGDQAFQLLTAVPEPGGLAMSALGLAAIAGLARRRRATTR
jgi:hypothetical protein